MSSYSEQLEHDLAHHRNRIAWLEGDDPHFADGSKVTGHDRTEMLKQSRAAIASPALAFNSCHCDPPCSDSVPW